MVAIARNIGMDAPDVYRVVLTVTWPDTEPRTWREGPYGKIGAAKARLSFWTNHYRRMETPPQVTGRLEKAVTVWTPLGEEA